MPRIQVGPMIFHVLHYSNQNKDPVEKITTFTLGNQKILAWVGTLDPLFGCRVILGIPENFILKGAVITRT